jgi:hypothetical protein
MLAVFPHIAYPACLDCDALIEFSSHCLVLTLSSEDCSIILLGFIIVLYGSV